MNNGTMTAKRRNILLVEDNPMNRELVTDLLDRPEFGLIVAETAEEGIRLARTRFPDLILMDIALPGMDGLTATAQLKRDPLTRAIPVVALTAQAMAGDAERALAAGCAAYISKPINTREFLPTLRQVWGTTHPKGGVPAGAPAANGTKNGAATLVSRPPRPRPASPRPTPRPKIGAPSRFLLGTLPLHGAHPPRVLVAEGDVLEREALTGLLEGFGCDVAQAQDGAECIAAARRRETDLLLIAAVLPDMPGSQVARRLRAVTDDGMGDESVAADRLRDLPILMRVPPGNRRERLSAAEAGATDVIAHSAGEVELRLRIGSLLSLQAARDDTRRSRKTLDAAVKLRTADLRRVMEETVRQAEAAHAGHRRALSELALAAERRRGMDVVTALQHLERVGNFSALIACGVGLPDDEVELVRVACRLHDVGHLLDDSEEDDHAALGAAFLREGETPLSAAAAVVALFHHERWDGTGRPNRLEGPAIPLYARICAVAHAFDEVARRIEVRLPSFSGTQVLDAAYDALQQDRGAALDPTLLDLFFDARDGAAILLGRSNGGKEGV